MAKTSKQINFLNEKDGVIQPDSMSKSSAERLKKNRQQKPLIQKLVKDLLIGNKSALSRAITLVESNAAKHQLKAKEIIEACLPYANKSMRIGITGVPGVGKSTFIEQFGKLLITQNKKVAVLAVDPSSSLSKGSILGDKTRMEDLVKEPNVFIRPSASGSSLGGVARKTRETIILCEAAGFDTIIIETVGVGQSETAVHSMTDFFLLMKLAGAGDELQGIKRGIMEMADIIVINKADGENVRAAKLAKTEFNRALHLYPLKDSGWMPKTLTCSATKNQEIDTIWENISDYISETSENGYFEQKRKEQNKFWLIQTIEQRLNSDFFGNAAIAKALKLQLDLLDKGATTPFEAAAVLLNFRV